MLLILLLLAIACLLLVVSSSRAKARSERRKSNELNADWLPTYGNHISYRESKSKSTTIQRNKEKTVREDIKPPSIAFTYDDDDKKQEIAYRNDTWEPNFYANGEEKKLYLELEIVYRDRNGNETVRQIKIKKYSINADKTEALIYAYCYLRGAGRNFYVSRIQNCTDLETGEIIENLLLYIEQKYDSSPEMKLKKIWSILADEANTLIYVGKVDGMLRKQKKEIIASYVLLKMQDCNLSLEEIIEDMKGATPISKTQFARTLGRLAQKSEEERQEIVDCAEKLLNTKKSKQPEEEAMLPYIIKRLFPKNK